MFELSGYLGLFLAAFGAATLLPMQSEAVLAGLLLALVGRILVTIGAGWRARGAEKALRASIGSVTAEQVIEPVQAELDRYARAVDAVARARAR